MMTGRATKQIRFWRRGAYYLVLTCIATVFLFPLVLMIVTSFKTDTVQVSRDLSSVLAFIPYGQIGLDNYVEIFHRVDFVKYLGNTFLFISVGLSLGILVNSMLAFALARLQWVGRRVVLVIVIGLIIVPGSALTVPLLQLVNIFGWFDTYQVVIIPFLAAPLTIFLLYQFFIGIPKEFDEAALMDGAGAWQLYSGIIMPLSKPALSTVIILGFLAGWGNYLWPLLTTHSPDYWPIMVGLSYFRGVSPVVPGQIMAYISLVSIPVIAVFAVFQRWFIASVSSAGVKG